MKGRSYLSSCNFLIDSDSEEKMGDELTILLEAFHKIEKAGGQATLSLSTSSGKTKVKLEIPTTAQCAFCQVRWPCGQKLKSKNTLSDGKKIFLRLFFLCCFRKKTLKLVSLFIFQH